MNRKIVAVMVVLAYCCTIPLASSQAPKGKSSKAAAPKSSATVSPEIKAAAHAAAASGCIASLWDHVYHPARLTVVEKCIEVTGTIHHIKREKDGDDHIQVKVDSPFDKLLNDRNKTVQADSLVVEPVCQGPDTQADAQTACRDFHSPVDVPARGAKVKIKGSFVLDTEPNHGWTEIHPVTSIIVE